MRTEADAVRLLAYVPQCTDAAIGQLEALAKSPGKDGRLLSDLAAAYYVRAHRRDHPSDLVRALDAAERATALSPELPEGRFNRALAEEDLGFSADAIRSWDGLRKSLPPPWSAEAERHYRKLRSQQATAAAIQWPLNLLRLPRAVQSGDRAAVLQLISPYRAAAQRHVEEVVFPAWAEAAGKGRTREASEQLALARTIATALARLTHDRYLLECVERIDATRDPAQLEALRKAHLDFRDARIQEFTFKFEPAALQYAKSEEEFLAGSSPLRLGAMLGRANALTFGKHYADAAELLGRLKPEVQRGHYPELLGRVYAALGYLRNSEGRYIDSLAEYGRAQRIFDRLHDDENLNKVYTRSTGVFRVIGHTDLMWREAFRAQRYAPGNTDERSRHLYLGEAALAASSLGCPAVALHYQNEAVGIFRNKLAHSTDDKDLEGLRRNLGIALRGRAAIRLRISDYKGAEADLNAAIPLIGKIRDANDAFIPAGFRAHLEEVKAQQFAPKDRKRAIEALSRGIDYALSTNYYVLLASLRMQRAELYRLDGNRRAAVEDLQRGIELLRAEEAANLKGPALPESEALWSAYFSRFQEPYRHLIEYLVEDGKDAEAFHYAERARAYEPLHLVLQRKDLPSQFREWTRSGEPMGLADVERELPRGTYLLEYTVLDGQTYVWIVSHDGFERRKLAVGKDDIENWTTTLQRFAAQRDVEGFEASLAAPYAALFQDPLARIARQTNGAAVNLVIVPDRAMHGLPFAALRDERGYLVQRHAVSVAASATLYAFSLAQDRKLSREKPASVLLFADPAFDKKLDVAYGLSPLHATRGEVERIRQIYAPFVTVQRRVDVQATIPELFRLVRESTVIHIAAHGIANPSNPSRSFLLLAPTENDRGVLDAERLLKELRVEKARLVVLSACSSAGGTPVGPEGFAPLVRPLVAAGVPAVVGTLWNVSESSATEQLLVQFHQHYRDGNDAGEALRLAQLDMLRDPDLERRSVLAWAPFQIIGWASSPFRPAPK